MHRNIPIKSHVSPGDIADYFNVSRESVGTLQKYVDELLVWQKRINLISASTIDRIWQRHICDALQLHGFISERESTIVDLGTGAGIPGIPLAIVLKQHQPDSSIVLIESNAKKAAFLRHVSRICEINVRIINKRVESINDSELQQPVDLCVARALAPLDKLLELTASLPVRPQRMLFLKGQDVDEELTQATKCWNISFIKHPSRTLARGCVLEIHEAERVAANTPSTSNQ
jgi:16S rRNA (guanine527-N7)-methyltransferase